MFTKILIANRGEIACRVIRTARRMGVKTVAVYSDADRNAQHVKLADQAVHIGGSQVSESYLVGERIIEAAKQTGAEAIHPGYGFLSENPGFVENVEAAGLTFIGPSASSIRAMGLKDAAKRLMEKAGVPVVPGYHGEAQELVVLAGKANEIGYPVLIKARAGGGGKGMRKVDRPEDFREALASAKREAKSSFGDDAVLVEKYVEKPRHIEVQVFGDKHGNVVHLYERDCSLQRRHQKVIEEAPAPGMSDEMRAAMTDAAVKAARAIDYVGAGTIEFIVDGSSGLRPDGFWFMEMNTRLQVEHPVTESVTGLDLVEWQLRVASGERLPRLQDEIEQCGHAFEARIYAEDVPKGFLPATGTLHHLHFPAGSRIDSGVVEGDAISPFYDPMIAKLITGGPDRVSALASLGEALDASRIAGSVTNLAFLRALAAHPGFSEGDVDTGLIARDIDALVREPDTSAEVWAVAALHALGLIGRAPAWSLWQPLAWQVNLVHKGEAEMLTASPEGSGWKVVTPSGPVTLDISRNGDRLELRSAEGLATMTLATWPGHVAVMSDTGTFEFAIPDPLDGDAADAHSGDHVISPMPGLVRHVGAVAGQKVARGEPLIILEAMKMEHSLTAPRDGVIASVGVSTGDQVNEGVVLLELEAAD
ncbi:MAG: acetyl/propionyl/methylcrotonyl-CoA carboxylase subunit alpha [Nitratireductor sp.]